MICYAPRTGTLRNIAKLKAAGWRWLISPHDEKRMVLHGMSYALDNGAWSAFQRGQPWDEAAFERELARFGPGADFIVVPDIVGDGRASLERSRQWLPRLLARPELASARLLIGVQDGMTFADIEPMTGGRVGLFIGGSTEWKVANIIPWGRWAKARGLYVHCGRVNTIKRASICLAGGIDSFDGAGPAKYARDIPLLTNAASQSDLFAPKLGAATSMEICP
jgi:hypothetical protein